MVIGKREKGAVLLALTERKTQEEIIVKLPEKSAKDVANAIDKLEKRYKKTFLKKFKTITFDNGAEFRNYKLLEKSCLHSETRFSVFYAHPYRSCEKGSNENCNRLIRRFVPKGTDINKVSVSFIKFVQHWINNFPRPMFDFKSASGL